MPNATQAPPLPGWVDADGKPLPTRIVEMPLPGDAVARWVCPVYTEEDADETVHCVNIPHYYGRSADGRVIALEMLLAHGGVWSLGRSNPWFDPLLRLIMDPRYGGVGRFVAPEVCDKCGGKRGAFVEREKRHDRSGWQVTGSYAPCDECSGTGLKREVGS